MTDSSSEKERSIHSLTRIREDFMSESADRGGDHSHRSSEYGRGSCRRLGYTAHTPRSTITGHWRDTLTL